MAHSFALVETVLYLREQLLGGQLHVWIMRAGKLVMPALVGLTLLAFFVLRSMARTALRLDDADATLAARSPAVSHWQARCRT